MTSRTQARRSVVAGNWKLNGNRHSATSLAQSVVDACRDTPPSACDVIVCPVSVHLADLALVVADSAVALGAQNCAIESAGAYTGEVAACMLAEYRCRYVIVGHSERRQLFGETDRDVARKSAAVLAAGMTPIICVGETLDEREAGDVQTVIGRQLDAVIAALSDDGAPAALKRVIIAYEPVWAIGTGKTASPAQAQEVHAFVRATLPPTVADQVRILYGGSVKPDNAATLFSENDIDGGLIGGASLNPADFLAICHAAG